MDEVYNLSSLIKEDLRQLGSEREFNQEQVQINLHVLFEYCSEKSTNFLQDCFGRSYKIKDPITWRFKNGDRYNWLVATISGLGFKTGKVVIENCGMSIQVLYIILLLKNFQIILIFRLLVPMAALKL